MKKIGATATLGVLSVVCAVSLSSAGPTDSTTSGNLAWFERGPRKFLEALSPDESEIQTSEFPANPYLETEKEALRLARQNSGVTGLNPVPMEAWLQSRDADAVALVADTHGEKDPWVQLGAAMEGGAQWVTLEYDSSLQPLLDRYDDSQDANETADLRREIADQLATGKWVAVRAEIDAFLAHAKAKGIKVCAVDTTEQYALFQFFNISLTVATRSLYWAQHLPPSGRGIVFGGGGHFFTPPNGSFPYFLHCLSPGRKVILIRPSTGWPPF